jgi:uncharacterized protein YaaR (DUF327 family)
MIQNKSFFDLIGEQSFETWFEEYKYSDSFEEYMRFDEREIELREEMELDGEDSKNIKEEVEKELKSYALDWYDERLCEFLDGIESTGNLLENSVRCMRVITFKEDELIQCIQNNNYGEYSGVGIYWSWDHSKAEAHWGSFSKGYEDIYIVSIIPFSCIDWKGTFLANLAPSTGYEEAEIKVKEGSIITVERVNNEVINLNACA